MSAERSGKMGPGREPKHADAMRIDVPFGGVGADDAERALRVLKRGRATWDTALNRARDI